MAIVKRSPLFQSVLLASVISLAACGGGGGKKRDTTPDSIAFAPSTNAATSAVITSPAVAISGINTATPVSISGGEYSINGGTFTSAAGTVTNGQTLVVRITASDKTNTPKEATLTVGSVSAKFIVTTAADVTPDAFAFPAKTEAAINTEYTSDPITVKGIDIAVPVSIAGGTYSINGGAYTAAAGTVSADQTITVKTTSGGDTETTQNAVLTVGGVTGTFAVTTLSDTTPPVAEFKFPTPYTMSEANEVKVRGIATDDHAITEVKLVVRSFNLATPDVTIETKEVIAEPKSEANGVKDFSSWTATVPLTATAENEIKVVATDDRDNEITIEQAKKVVIRQADVNSAFPDNENPLGSPFGGIVIDNYEGRNRLLISDQIMQKIFAISVITGERTVYKEDDAKLFSGLLVVEQSGTPALYALDIFTNSLQKMNLWDGSIIDTYYSDTYKEPFKLILDDSGDSKKIISVNTEDSSDVISFDLQTESFSIVSSDINYPRIPNASVIAFDKKGDRYLTNVRDNATNLYGIYSVNKSSGERQAFSTNEVGSGELFESRASLGAIELDTEKNVLYGFETRSGKIYEIDLTNGNRRVLTELKYTDRYSNLLSRTIISARVVKGEQYAYVGDSRGDALLVVDLSSGEKVILSKAEQE